MPALRLTPKMVVALERLYEASHQQDYVQYMTAWALKSRGLVLMARNPQQRTASGQFPDYLVELSNSGRAWCQRHFARVRRSA
jgi:hypothetical protein